MILDVEINTPLRAERRAGQLLRRMDKVKSARESGPNPPSRATTASSEKTSTLPWFGPWLTAS
jgi:hypothetical protein